MAFIFSTSNRKLVLVLRLDRVLVENPVLYRSLLHPSRICDCCSICVQMQSFQVVSAQHIQRVEETLQYTDIELAEQGKCGKTEMYDNICTFEGHSDVCKVSIYRIF